jgi:murein DD-endopeptidase MepM/ murein hydrolase activator NlpD
MRPRGSRRRISHAHRIGASQSPPIPQRRFLALIVAAASVVLLAGRFVPGGAATTTLLDRAADSGASSPAADPNAVAASRTLPLVDLLGDRPDAVVPNAAPTAAPPQTLTGYRWPLDHARITQAFGPSAGGTFVVAGQRFHDGIDIASFCGAPIVAAHAGTVIAAGRRTDAALGWIGNLAAYHARLDQRQLWGTLAIIVVIDDGNGYRSIYAHFHRIVVKVGERVHAGTFLGTEGATGHASGCHLHYGLFSPAATGRYVTEPTIVQRTLIPAVEIARIDPLTVLPDPKVVFNTWGWGAGDGH